MCVSESSCVFATHTHTHTHTHTWLVYTGLEEVTHQEKSQNAHRTKLIDYVTKNNYNSEKDGDGKPIFINFLLNHHDLKRRSYEIKVGNMR